MQRFFTDGYFIYVKTVSDRKQTIQCLFDCSCAASDIAEFLNRSKQEDYPAVLDIEFCELLVTALVRQNPANLPKIVKAGVRGIEKRARLRKLRRAMGRV